MTSIADQLLAFATLCDDAADLLADQISKLGARPDEALPAKAWDLSVQRLNGQINSLTRAAMDDSSLAVSQALAAHSDELDELERVTDVAEARIKEIAKASDLLTTVGRVLDVALALVTVAHDPTALPTLIDKIDALSTDVGADA